MRDHVLGKFCHSRALKRLCYLRFAPITPSTDWILIQGGRASILHLHGPEGNLDIGPVVAILPNRPCEPVQYRVQLALDVLQ